MTRYIDNAGRVARHEPVITQDARIIELAANAVAGTAEDLLAAISTAVAAIPVTLPCRPMAIDVTNPGPGDAWLRGTTLGAVAPGEGILIPARGERRLNLYQVPDETLLYEASNVLYIHLLF